MLLLTGCFTGVESTQRIKLDKKSLRETRESEEEKYFSEVKGIKLADWKEGKRFYVTDPKLSLMLIHRSVPTDSMLIPRRGDILSYKGVCEESHPDGSTSTAITLSGHGHEYLYDTGQSPEESLRAFTSFDMQTLVDMDALEKAASMLEGKTFWTRSILWYDDDDNDLLGHKFVAVKIDSVTPGTMVFPLKVYFTDSRGVHAHYYMSAEGSPGASSRRFHHLFALDDVKKQYPKIEAEVWELICEGKVRAGMTKDECRLSLGRPKDSDSGRSYSSTLDVWTYDGGRYLRFVDGLLTDFRY